jgi:hypothetical protein
MSTMGKGTVCPVCEGRGVADVPLGHDEKTLFVPDVCPMCHGNGTVVSAERPEENVAVEEIEVGTVAQSSPGQGMSREELERRLKALMREYFGLNGPGCEPDGVLMLDIDAEVTAEEDGSWAVNTTVTFFD